MKIIPSTDPAPVRNLLYKRLIPEPAYEVSEDLNVRNLLYKRLIPN